MDYVVFGIGFGATILVLGLLLRDLGPRLRYRQRANGDGVLPADVLVAKVAWDRFCNALGAVLAIGGILFLLTTFVCIFLMLSNDTGGWVMLVSIAVFFLLTLYWTWAFFDRFGAYGILPERPVSEEAPEPEPRRQPTSQPAAAAVTSNATPDAVNASARRETAVIGPTLEETASAAAHAGLEESGEPSGDDKAETAERAAEAGETEPEPVEGEVITPEERLAQMAEPIDHGSAAGDLDAEPSGGRPSSTHARWPETSQGPEEAIEAAADGTEAGDAAVEPGDSDGETGAGESTRPSQTDDSEPR